MADDRSPQPSRLERPIFVVAPAGSGASYLFGLLARSTSLWTRSAAFDGNHEDEAPPIEAMPALHPSNRGWDSDRLTAPDATAPTGPRFRELLGTGLVKVDGSSADDDATGIRLLDANLRNALSVPFLNAIFPQSIFIYLYRDPREGIENTLEGWEGGQRVSYEEVPGWDGMGWSYVLTPEWRGLAGRPLPEICARQWTMTTRVLLSDLDRLAPDRWCVVDHGALVAEPEREFARLSEFAGIDPPPADVAMPDDDSGIRELRRFAEIDPVAGDAEALATQARGLIADPTVDRPAEPVDLNSPTTSPLRSVNSSNLVDILDQLRSSLLVSTYQTGKLVAIRKDGYGINTSPRWYRDRLWVLESGEGAIGYVDLDTGKVETVAKLPGFTRGLSFAGPLAFIGLSEVRESTTFGGLPLTGRLEERQCGVWVVNIETGETIAFLRFEDLVQEIFAVMVLPGMRFPEIAEHGSKAVELTYVLPDADLKDTV